MDLATFLNSYFTLALITKLIERHKPVRSIIFDLVFGVRTNTPSSRVRLDDVLKRTGNLPVVARGAMALAVGGQSGTRTEIEPMPIRLSQFITGADLNDFRSLYGNGDERGQALVQTKLDNMVLDLMRSTEMTRNALCAQAITGKIDYMMQNEGGFERYQVLYGDGVTLAFSPAIKWNDDACTLAMIINDLSEMEDALMEEGNTGEVKFMVGKKAFAAISNKIASMTNDNRIDAKAEKGTISIGGYEIVKNSITYKDRNDSGAEVIKHEVDPEKIVAFVTDIPELTYCAVDDVDGNLEAVPFFSKTIKIEDPSGYKVISESKPMPLVSSKGFCWATVFDASIVNKATVAIYAEGVTLEQVEKTYTEASLTALTKAAILGVATERGYEMTKTDADTKAEIITEFLALQLAAQA
ncbi:MAG TPA: major capsid protein [Sphaerochaeta sp.]|nr:major capsid protein [Sphaerochaeta sp.]